ncbi:MAG: hypothetical protein AB4426_34090 [Xenococcaceae cyanobacterium]
MNHALPGAIAVLLLAALLTAQWNTAMLLFGGLATYILALALLAGILDQAVVKLFRARGEQTTSFSFAKLGKILLAMPLTMLVQLIALILTMLMQSVEWRGITYQIQAPWDIRLVKYQPYQYSAQQGDRNVSL